MLEDNQEELLLEEAVVDQVASMIPATTITPTQVAAAVAVLVDESLFTLSSKELINV